MRFARQAEAQINGMAPPEAATHLRNKIAEYKRWLAAQGDNAMPRDRTPAPDIYVLLARQMDAAGQPKEQVAAAYEQAFRNLYTDTRLLPGAFSWLAANMPAEHCEGVIRDLVRTERVPYGFVYGITAHLAGNKNWSAIETFLNALFAEIDDPLSRAAAVDWALQDTVGDSDAFLLYCRGKPGLTRHLFRSEERTALGHVARGDFKAAAKVYSDILKRCEPGDNRIYYAVRVCETLFNGGFYEQAVNELDGFIREYKPRNRSLLVPLTMLKGRSHVNLGDVERAIDSFVTVLLEYPESAQAPEACFFVGYCQMLLGRFEDAAGSFKVLMQDYPASTYVAKAQSYLDRIHAMTRQE